MKIEQYLALSILSYSKSLSSFASSGEKPSIEALIKQGKIDNYRHSDGSIYLECKPLLSHTLTPHQRYNLQNKKNNSIVLHLCYNSRVAKNRGCWEKRICPRRN